MGFATLIPCKKSWLWTIKSICQLKIYTSEILCHLIHNESKYSNYHEGDIANDCEKNFHCCNYVQSIVDVIVHCTH